VLLTFAHSEGATGSEEQKRYWTPEEFEQLKFDENGILAEIYDEDAKTSVPGPFKLTAIAGKDAVGSPKELLAKVRDQKKQQMRRGKQVEIFVAHGNIIRYTFLRLMQFDTARWIDLGGSNCTITQMRIRPDGSVGCDFFAAHESKMPLSHYTYNKSSDV